MIEDIISNTASTVSNYSRAAIDTATNAIKTTVGTAAATISSLYDGGFVGINASNITTITDAVNNMITKIEAEMDNFNVNTEFSVGVKGEAEAAASEYVKAVKELVAAYVSTYKTFIKLANDSVEQMQTGDTANAQSIRTGAEAILKEANNIRVDE